MSAKIRCIAVDDESLARKMLEDYILKIPFLELVKTCKNTFEAMEVLANEKVDLMFLDIQMPGMLGTQFLSTLTKRPKVIFITAYDQYAVESYSLDVVDYVLKPVGFDRFVKAVNKAKDIIYGETSNSTTEVMQIPLPNNYIFVNVEYAIVKINLDQVTHIEGLKDYIKIFLLNTTHPILTKSTLKGIEEKLPNSRFIRVQKSFIINIDKIESIRNHRITIGKYEIPVSEINMPTLLEAINYTKP